MSDLNTDAILLFAHGSRAPDLKAELGRVAELVKASTGIPIVEMAFLELAEPDMHFGVKTCVGQGARRVTVVPYLLNVGNHLRRDLPGLIGEVRKAFPGTEILLAPHLGADQLLADLVAKRAGQAKSGEDPI